MSIPTTVRRLSGVPARRTTNTTSGESASTSALDAAKGQCLDQRVLDDSAQLERRGFEIVGRPEVNRDSQRRRRGQAGVVPQRRQELVEQWLESHRRHWQTGPTKSSMTCGDGTPQPRPCGRRTDRGASPPLPASVSGTRMSNGDRMTRRFNSASITRFAPPEPVSRISSHFTALRLQTSTFRPQLSALSCQLSVLYTPFERWNFVIRQGFRTAGFNVHACSRASSINAGAWKPSGKIGQLQSAAESSAT